MPRLLAACWKKPFSEQLSPVHVRPDSQMSRGTFDLSDEGGRYRLNFISHPVVEASWASLRSFPPKEAMVAVVLTDISGTREGQWGRPWTTSRVGSTWCVPGDIELILSVQLFARIGGINSGHDVQWGGQGVGGLMREKVDRGRCPAGQLSLIEFFPSRLSPSLLALGFVEIGSIFHLTKRTMLPHPGLPRQCLAECLDSVF